MKLKPLQTGMSLNGFITVLLSFAIVAFGAGWFFKYFYANRLYLSATDKPDFPFVLKNMEAKSAGLTFDGQSLVFTNQVSPWGIVRVTPLENGHYRKSAFPVIDGTAGQQLSFQGITWNGENFIAITDGGQVQSPYEKVFVQLNKDDFSIDRIIAEAPDQAHCIAWDGIHYWIGSWHRKPNQVSPDVLYQFDKSLSRIAEYPVAGKNCAGMTWDGKYLWWADANTSELVLYDLSRLPPQRRHAYEHSVKSADGIASDGKDIWLGSGHKLSRLDQELYFDWLGGRFDIANHNQLQSLARLHESLSGPSGIDELINPLVQGKIRNGEISSYIDTLRDNYSPAEIIQVLIKAREQASDEAFTRALNHEIEGLIDSGQIDYADESTIDDEAMKLRYFRGAIDQGNLVVGWKVTAGSAIAGGVDTERPHTVPEDFEFNTFIRYLVRTTDQSTDETVEHDFDMFDEEDIQDNVVLINNMQRGEHLIEVEMTAQYFFEGKAKSYNNLVQFKVSY